MSTQHDLWQQRQSTGDRRDPDPAFRRASPGFAEAEEPLGARTVELLDLGRRGADGYAYIKLTIEDRAAVFAWPLDPFTHRSLAFVLGHVKNGAPAGVAGRMRLALDGVFSDGNQAGITTLTLYRGPQKKRLSVMCTRQFLDDLAFFRTASLDEVLSRAQQVEAGDDVATFASKPAVTGDAPRNGSVPGWHAGGPALGVPAAVTAGAGGVATALAATAATVDPAVNADLAPAPAVPRSVPGAPRPVPARRRGGARPRPVWAIIALTGAGLALCAALVWVVLAQWNPALSDLALTNLALRFGGRMQPAAQATAAASVDAAVVFEEYVDFDGRDVLEEMLMLVHPRRLLPEASAVVPDIPIAGVEQCLPLEVVDASPAPNVIRRIRPHQAALTFDDGPSPYTEQFVDILDRYGVKGTFFFIGQHIERYPDAVVYAYERGHTIGNHTVNHRMLTALSAAEQAQEIEGAAAQIEALTGAAPAVFRPPYGAWNDTTQALAADYEMPLLLWNNDPKDWMPTSAEAIAASVLSYDLSGAVILLHETRATLEALPVLIEAIMDRNLSLCAF